MDKLNRTASNPPLYRLARTAIFLFGAGMLLMAAAKAGKGLELHSPAYGDGGRIPARFTCDGSDTSPPLQWSGIPAGTRSLALILDDPDAPDPRAPRITWVHWVLYNVPPTADGLPAGADTGTLPQGSGVGKNSWGRTDYGGPCPPIGRHRYVHKLYALDAVLPDLDAPTSIALQRAMRGHILAETTLTATYAHRN